MILAVQELIDRARVLIDDDHDDQQFIEPAQWLSFFNVERAQLHRRWVRTGLVTSAPQDQQFSTNTVVVPGVLATVGVAEDLGAGRLRVIQGAQSEYGRAPFWTRQTGAGRSQRWSATGLGDDLTYTLEPSAPGNYLVRYIAMLPRVTLPTATTEVPDGGDERLVLGMARRAQVKASGASRMIESLIQISDAELNMLAAQRSGGARVRVKDRAPSATFSTLPRDWMWR